MWFACLQKRHLEFLDAAPYETYNDETDDATDDVTDDVTTTNNSDAGGLSSAPSDNSQAITAIWVPPQQLPAAGSSEAEGLRHLNGGPV